MSAASEEGPDSQRTDELWPPTIGTQTTLDFAIDRGTEPSISARHGPHGRVVHFSPDWVRSAAEPLGDARRLDVFTSARARTAKPRGGAWGFVLLDVDSQRAVEVGGASAGATLNRLEMLAAIHALDAAFTVDADVRAFVDHLYLYHACTRWIEAWKAAGWRRKRRALANVDLLRRLDYLMCRRGVSWRWVPPHVGHRGNALADDLVGRVLESTTGSARIVRRFWFH